MEFLPEVFEVRKVFFGLGGVNKISYQNGTLTFEHIPDLEGDEHRKTEITPLREDWINFWNEMEDIDAWTWEEEYVPPPDIDMDGDVIDVNILFNHMKIKTNCWCSSPPHFEEFYYALYDLIDLHLDNPGGF